MRSLPILEALVGVGAVVMLFFTGAKGEYYVISFLLIGVMSAIMELSVRMREAYSQREKHNERLENIERELKEINFNLESTL